MPEKRYRPLGLSIAILATAIGYGVIPLLPVLLIVWSQVTRRNVGVDFVGGLSGWVSVGFAALTLIACVLAWVGRPRGARRLLLTLIWVTTIIAVIRILEASARPTVVIGEAGGSLSGSYALVCQVPLLVFIPLYTTWYLNRAPARQFYER